MRAAAIWICCCAYLNGVGWILSAIHQLNFLGYTVALILGIVALLFWRKKNSEFFLLQIRWQKFLRRLRKPFPLAFFIVAVLAFFGGAVHAPNNYDAMTYRLPRILNWLAAGHWFWILSINERMNYSMTAWEWLATPFFALFKSDRGLFLINIAVLFMPGMLFSIFRKLGVARKVAWMWMWILPLAYGYALQMGSAGNDLTGTIFLLASVFFGLRARDSKKISDLWLAGLAAALMTSSKLSNLPLLLPCLIAVWPALKELRKKIFVSFIVACAAILISAAPTIVLNQIHTGSWTGDPNDSSGIRVKSPLSALLGNGILLMQQSFMPPVLPDAHKINPVLNDEMPASWQQTLRENFPRYYFAKLNELPQEESAGLGLGVTLLLLVGLSAVIFRVVKNSRIEIFSQTSLFAFAAWIAALVYMLKMGSEATARLMLPYYPLVIVPFLLLPSQNYLLRFRAWKIFCMLAVLSVLPAIILSPSRPLLPMEKISKQLAAHHPASVTAQRLASVYFVYAHRNDSLAPLREHLPDDVKVIGFVAGSDDTDYSLWRPIGKRKVVYLQNDIKSSDAIPDSVKWIAVKQKSWRKFSNLPLETWAMQHQAQIVFSNSITTLVSRGPETWLLLHIQK
jgi:hypothetical protein